MVNLEVPDDDVGGAVDLETKTGDVGVLVPED
jgi:hypothetical protein